MHFLSHVLWPGGTHQVAECCKAQQDRRFEETLAGKQQCRKSRAALRGRRDQRYLQCKLPVKVQHFWCQCPTFLMSMRQMEWREHHLTSQLSGVCSDLWQLLTSGQKFLKPVTPRETSAERLTRPSRLQLPHWSIKLKTCYIFDSLLLANGADVND